MTTASPSSASRSSASPSSEPAQTRVERALVLGGGGSTGNAWLTGLLAGLRAAGTDVTDADLVVGTSAGATVAAQLVTADPADLYAALLAVAADRAALARRGGAGVAGRPGVPGGPGAGGPVVDLLARIRAVIDGASDVDDMHRRMGASSLALEASSDGTWSASWRATVASRFPARDWPERELRIAALDARTGTSAVFDRDSGVELVDAVAASTSSGLPYAVGDERYIDGGYRRNENADLASGARRVLVLAPLGGRTLHPSAWGMQLDAQVDELRAGGSVVEIVVPDAASEHLFGVNGMNPALRPAAARAGHEQGIAVADRVRESWR